MKKNAIVSFLFVQIFILLLIAFTCFELYTEWINYTKEGLKVTMSSYSIWYNLFGGRWGQILCFMSPILIAISCITPFLIELESGFYKDIILRKGYFSYFKTCLMQAYLKAVLIFPVLYGMSFIILSIFFSNHIGNGTGLAIESFAVLHGMQPLLYILLSIICVSLYSFVIVNICFIIAYFIQKPAIHFLVTFLFINFINLLIGNIAPLLLNQFYGFDFYNGFICSNELYINLTIRLFIFYFILSSMILYFLYKRKEKVCLL